MEIDQDDAVFIRYLKLAVAIAIIRSRPVGLSGQQYAQSLCKQYQKSQLSWKEKAKSLEQELLLVRQKALHCQLTKAVQPKPVSDDAFPTPPSSAEAAAYAASDSDSMTLVNFSDHRTILSKHTSFLQSIITLSSLSSRSGIWDNAEITAHTLDIVKSSLDSLTDFLVEEMNNKSGPCEGLGSEVGLHSVTVVSQFADIQTGSRCTVETVHRLILKSAQRFIDAIVNSNGLNKFASKFQICQYILMLAKASVLREGILWLLLQQVVACSEMLRLSINKEVILEPHTMENIYYIFWCIEQLLCGDSGRRGGELPDKLCRDVAFLLSESLLHISQNFSIFAHYVWHIGELVEGVKKK